MFVQIDILILNNLCWIWILYNDNFSRIMLLYKEDKCNSEFKKTNSINQ